MAYRQTMLERVNRRVHNTPDAEDIVSECWLSLLKHARLLSGLEGKARSTYIMRSLENKVTDFFRASTGNKDIVSFGLLNTNVQIPHESSASDVDELQRIIADDITSILSPREEAVVRMKRANIDTACIAQSLGIKPVSVRVYWMRAKQKLRSLSKIT